MLTRESSITDVNVLQTEIKSLLLWADPNGMQFAVEGTCLKCSLGETPLEPASQIKDLGVIISNSISWNHHVSSRTNKANLIFGMIRRNIPCSTTTIVKLPLYKSMILAFVIFGSSCWAPNRTEMRKIECVQRRITNWIRSYPDRSTYKSRLISLNLLPLSLYMEVVDLLTFSSLSTKRVLSTGTTLCSLLPIRTPGTRTACVFIFRPLN